MGIDSSVRLPSDPMNYDEFYQLTKNEGWIVRVVADDDSIIRGKTTMRGFGALFGVDMEETPELVELLESAETLADITNLDELLASGDLHGNCDLSVTTLADHADDPEVLEEINEATGGWEVMTEYHFMFTSSGHEVAEAGYDALTGIEGAIEVDW